MAGTVHSYKGRVELQDDGVSGSAGWDHLDLIGNARLRISRAEAKTPRRGVEFKTSEVGQADVELSFLMAWHDTDAQVSSIEAAVMANLHRGVKFLDQASGTGMTADFRVKDYEHTQDEDQGQAVNVTMVPVFVDTAPSWS